jgi:DNA helicase-4
MLRGLDVQEATRFYTSVRKEWVRTLGFLLDEWRTDNREAFNFVNGLNRPLRYVRESQIARYRQSLAQALKALPNRLPAELSAHFVHEHLAKLTRFAADPKPMVLAANGAFIKEERSRYQHLFETIESNPLSEEQQIAVVTDEDHNLVVAAAGSGKTSVIVAKLAHLLAQGDIHASEILILAFNRAARDELRERILEKVDSPSVQETSVMTFHELGYSIIGYVTERKPSVARHAAETWKAAQYIREIIEDLRSQEDFEQSLLEWFAWYLHQYKSAFEFESLGEYYEYLRENDIVTMKGELVKSHEECMIANFLHLNGIAYEYEADYEISSADALHRQYQPDFLLCDYGIYIEHFGIDRDGHTAPFVDEDDYRRSMEWKRDLHRVHETILLETYSYQKWEGELLTSLRNALEDRGVKFNPVSAEQRLEELKKRTEYDRFSELVAVFLKHFKSNEFDRSALINRAAGSSDPERANAFINIFWSVYEKYEAELSRANEVDFESMIREATKLTVSRAYRSSFRYILVDEFQDISVGRAELLKALCRQNIENQLFAVGDDWQSIYRFAGSDISVMRDFDRYFGATATSLLSTTYRCNQELVDVSGSFISANPAQLQKPVRALTQRNGCAIFVVRPSKEIPEPVHESLRRICLELQCASVLVLGRYRHSKPNNWSELQTEFRSLTLKYRTIHSAKGLEADYVVVVGLSAGMYGFPSEIEDDPLLDLVLAEQEPFGHAEERRLFYVAITRAKHGAFLIAPEARCSAFVEEIEVRGNSIERLGADPAARAHCPACTTGLLSLRSGKNGKFVGCENYPRCTYTSNSCPSCGQGIVAIANGRGVCNGCQAEFEVCPRCSDGYLHLRTGKYGEFWGCSSYPACRYTRDASNRRES